MKGPILSPGRLDTKSPTTAVFRIVHCFMLNSFQQTCLSFITPRYVSFTVISIKFNSNPKYISWWDGVNFDFTSWRWKASCLSRVLVSKTLALHSSYVSPCRQQSSMYDEDRCLFSLSTWNTSFMNLVKILGAEARPLGRQVYWYNLSLHTNLRYFWCSNAIGTP